MRVLVTGGAGYVGSVTAAALIEGGHEVIVLDDLRNGHREFVPPEARFVEADVARPDTYRDVLDGVEACLHFAASIEAGESMRRPEAFFTNNTAATMRLIEALVDSGVGRFVLSSTAAVYGEPSQVPIDEDDPTEPVNAYGASKLMIEQALEWVALAHGLRFACLRYFNASGATFDRGEAHDPESHLIPIVLQAAAGLRDGVSVFGSDYDTPDGTCIRDYVHVSDLANAHLLALTALDDHDRVICNLGNARGFSVLEVIEAARRVTGRPIAVREEPRRHGDPAVLVASSQRAHDLLGWRPAHTTIEEIVGSAWQWHRRAWQSDQSPDFPSGIHEG